MYNAITIWLNGGITVIFLYQVFTEAQRRPWILAQI